MGKKKKKLLEYAGNYRYLTYIACFLSAISALFSLLPYLYIWNIGKTVFEFYPEIYNAGGLLENSIKALIFALVSIIIYFVALMFSHVSAFRTAKNMRSKALHHLVKLPLGYFDHEGSGKLRRVIDESAGQTEAYLAHQLPDLVAAYVTPIALVLGIVYFDFRLGIVSLIPLVIGVFFLKKMMGESMAGSMANYQNSLEEMNNQAVEYIRGIPVVKVFQQSIFSFKNFHRAILAYKEWAVKYTLSMRIPLCAYTLSINSFFAVLIPGGILLFKAAQNPADFMQDFVFYILITPLMSLMLNRIMFSGEKSMLAMDAKKRIESILETEALEVSDKLQNQEYPKDMKIEFENVCFTYKGMTRPAINKLSITIEHGQTVALVGPSGGGKTTLAQLIPRFWDIDEGEIRLGGVNIRHIDHDVLMDHIAFVFQENHLFKGTLIENIQMARPTATENQIMEALKQARCLDIVNKLPEGIHTVIGEKGIYLSGGEVQRLTLARAILKNAPLIILDEATAYADPENEYQIQDALGKLTKDKTVLMIAHRLSTIRNADCIYVLNQGEIEEQGTHQELLSIGGRYWKMWQEYEKATHWKVTI